MKKNVFTVLILFILAACNSDTAKTSSSDDSIVGAHDKANVLSPDDANRITALFRSTDPASGKVVTFKSADSCIKKYKAEMLKHGFGSSADPNISTWQSEILKITHGVAFRGNGLGSYVLDILNRIIPTDDEMEIHAEFGIYTKEFVVEHFSWPKDSAAKYNRVTVFLVPYQVKKGAPVKGDPPPPPDDEKVYNLGGLRP